MIDEVYTREETIPALFTTSASHRDEKFTALGIAFGDVIYDGRNTSAQEARGAALLEMWSKARAMGADRVVDVRLQYAPLPADKFVVTVYGTAVRVIDELWFLKSL